MQYYAMPFYPAQFIAAISKRSPAPKKKEGRASFLMQSVSDGAQERKSDVAALPFSVLSEYSTV